MFTATLIAGSLALALIAVVLGSPAPGAHAQDATPTQITDLGLDRESIFGLIGATPTISWREIEGVDHFQLTVTLLAARVNRADPFCTPPAESDMKTIAFDETLPGTTTGRTISLPLLPDADAWFVYQPSVFLRAFAADGSQIGGQGGGGVSETLCPRSTFATATPEQSMVLDTSSFDDLADPHRAIRWLAIAGAVSYQVIFELQIARVNAADPDCGRPAQPENRTLTVNESVPGSSTSFELPPLPPGDAWAVGGFTASVRAVDSNGTQIVGAGTLAVVEGGSSCQGRTVALPETGDGGSRERDSTLWWMLATFGGGVSVFCAGWGMRRQAARR